MRLVGSDVVEFEYTDIHQRTWRVCVSREAAEDGAEADLSNDEFLAWVDDNALDLSEIAQKKIDKDRLRPGEAVWLRSADVHP
jgi:hypothetical protein